MQNKLFFLETKKEKQFFCKIQSFLYLFLHFCSLQAINVTIEGIKGQTRYEHQLKR